MEGNFPAGEAHYKRALRIHDSLGTIPGRMELQSAWAQAVTASGHPQGVSPLRSSGTAASQVLQGLAAVLAHGDRPGLVAREVVEILASTDCVHSARAVARERESQMRQSRCKAIPARPRPYSSHLDLSMNMKYDCSFSRRRTSNRSQRSMLYLSPYLRCRSLSAHELSEKNERHCGLQTTRLQLLVTR